MSDTSLGSSGVDLPNSPLEHMRTRSGSGSRPGSSEEAVVDGHEPPHHIVPKASSTGIWIVRDESGEAEGGGESLLMPEPASAPLAVVNFQDTSGDIRVLGGYRAC